ncbi:MAG: hypothetical protein ABFD44_00420 [Anaerolineaceae bacterium]
MLDNLRDEASFVEEEPVPEELSKKPAKPSRPFLGMTPAQRFVIALLLFLMICLLGTFCLLVTERVVLPIM